MSFVFPVLAGGFAFCIILPLVTFLTAWIADLTGLFRVLFIHKPSRLAFRLARWAIAVAAAVAVAMAVH